MSRSYKKTPRCGDNKGSNKKRFAWKKVRQYIKEHPDELINNSLYKKIYESYDICDYSFFNTWEEYWDACQKWHEEALRRGYGPYLILDKDVEYRYWYTHYKGK